MGSAVEELVNKVTAVCDTGDHVDTVCQYEPHTAQEPRQ